jgi:hypothetical protein
MPIGLFRFVYCDEFTGREATQGGNRRNGDNGGNRSAEMDGEGDLADCRSVSFGAVNVVVWGVAVGQFRGGDCPQDEDCGKHGRNNLYCHWDGVARTVYSNNIYKEETQWDCVGEYIGQLHIELHLASGGVIGYFEDKRRTAYFQQHLVSVVARYGHFDRCRRFADYNITKNKTPFRRSVNRNLCCLPVCVVLLISPSFI